MSVEVNCPTSKSSQFGDNHADQHRLAQLKSSSVSSDVLCRITFDLNERQEELLVYQDTTLKGLTEELIFKLMNSEIISEEDVRHMTEDDKAVLKGQIKDKISLTMEMNVEKSLQAAKWRNKLKDIIQEKIRTPMDSLISPSTQRQTPIDSKSKAVSYFKYNHPQNEQSSKELEIIERMRCLNREINKQSKSKQVRPERLYDLGKQTDLLREYLSKIHEYETLEEELSECTFHPNIKKINGELKAQSSTSDVFSRLYHQAIDKQEKMKRIEHEVQNRQQEEYKHFNFIPQINQCSKEIVMAKKENKNIYQSLYREANLKSNKKKFQPQYTFQPTICQKSEEILKKKAKNGLQKCQSKQLSKRLGKEATPHQQSSASLHHFVHRTEHSHSKSPLPKKDNSTRRLDHYKLNRGSNINIKKQEDTLKKLTYHPQQDSESESTLKQNFFSKKPFKKQKPNLTRQDSCYVNQKDIKRQKIIIIDATEVTANTEQSFQKYDIQYSEPSQSSYKDSTKKNRIDPYAFFQERQKMQKVNNKQNIKEPERQNKEEKTADSQFQKRKNKIFQEIFTYLLSHSSSENEVTYEAIVNTSSIPETLKHIFYPMADEMRQLGVGLDKQQFVWSMIRIFDSLSLQERGWILGWGLKIQQPAESTKKFR